MKRFVNLHAHEECGLRAPEDAVPSRLGEVEAVETRCSVVHVVQSSYWEISSKYGWGRIVSSPYRLSFSR